MPATLLVPTMALPSCSNQRSHQTLDLSNQVESANPSPAPSPSSRKRVRFDLDKTQIYELRLEPRKRRPSSELRSEKLEWLRKTSAGRHGGALGPSVPTTAEAKKLAAEKRSLRAALEFERLALRGSAAWRAAAVASESPLASARAQGGMTPALCALCVRLDSATKLDDRLREQMGAGAHQKGPLKAKESLKRGQSAEELGVASIGVNVNVDQHIFVTTQRHGPSMVNSFESAEVSRFDEDAVVWLDQDLSGPALRRQASQKSYKSASQESPEKRLGKLCRAGSSSAPSLALPGSFVCTVPPNFAKEHSGRGGLARTERGWKAILAKLCGTSHRVGKKLRAVRVILDDLELACSPATEATASGRAAALAEQVLLDDFVPAAKKYAWKLRRHVGLPEIQ